MLEGKVFTNLINYTRTVMQNLADTRQPSNATKYSMESAGMAGFSVFMMQDPSFLSHQERLQEDVSNNNFHTLFGCKNIPSPNQIRNLLDNVDPAELTPLYDNALSVLKEQGGLKKFSYLQDTYLIALDGTEFYTSDKLHCASCSTKEHKDHTRYSHSMLATSIVSPDIKEAISLIPEFILPQDGHQKQDCENAAAKRWLNKYGAHYKHLNPTILGDDLFSRQPICDAILEQDYHLYPR
jgi:hypothetical protein